MYYVDTSLRLPVYPGELRKKVTQEAEAEIGSGRFLILSCPKPTHPLDFSLM